MVKWMPLLSDAWVTKAPACRIAELTSVTTKRLHAIALWSFNSWKPKSFEKLEEVENHMFNCALKMEVLISASPNTTLGESSYLIEKLNKQNPTFSSSHEACPGSGGWWCLNFPADLAGMVQGLSSWSFRASWPLASHPASRSLSFSTCKMVIWSHRFSVDPGRCHSLCHINENWED